MALRRCPWRLAGDLSAISQRSLFAEIWKLRDPGERDLTFFPPTHLPLGCSAMSHSITDLDDHLLSEIAKSLLRCDRFDVPAIAGSGDDILQFSYMCRAFRGALSPFLQEARIRRNGRIWPMGTDELASTRQTVAEDLSRELLRLFVDAMRKGIFLPTNPESFIDRFNDFVAPRGKATILCRNRPMIYFCADDDTIYTLGTHRDDQDISRLLFETCERDGTPLERISTIDHDSNANLQLCFPEMYTRRPGAPPLLYMTTSSSVEYLGAVVPVDTREILNGCTYRREGDKHTKVNTYRFESTSTLTLEYVFFNSRSEVCAVRREDRGESPGGFASALRYGFYVENIDTGTRSPTYCDYPHDVVSMADLLVVHHGSHLSMIQGPDHTHRVVVPMAPAHLLGGAGYEAGGHPFTSISRNGQFIVASSWNDSYIIRLVDAAKVYAGHRMTRINGIIEKANVLDWIFTACSRFCMFFDSTDDNVQQRTTAKVHIVDMSKLSLHDHGGTKWSKAARLEAHPLKSAVTTLGNIPHAHVPEVIQFSETSFAANGKNLGTSIDRLVGVELDPARVRHYRSRRGLPESAASSTPVGTRPEP